MAEQKWRGILGGLEEQKAPLDLPSLPSGRRRYAVRPVPRGYAVFDPHGKRVSEVFLHKSEAIAEAEAYVGGDGIVEVETETGHIEREHIERR